MPARPSSARGAYPVQPVAIPPKAIADIRMRPAAGTSQNVSDSSRGNAMRRAPIMIGTR